MNKAYTLSTLLVIQSLDPIKDLFRLKEDNEQVPGPEVPYLNVIGALKYLTKCSRSGIAFPLNLLVKFSFEPTKGYWINGVKTCFLLSE